MKKIGKAIKRFFMAIYRIIDKLIVTPISRLIFNIREYLRSKNLNKLDYIFNRPHFMIYVSLILAVVVFLLIDSRVITLVESEAEVITNVPVTVNYNEEAYVVEGIPETVDIVLIGRKSDIYLAKQLGTNNVILDLSDYDASDTPQKVALTYNQTVDNINYKLDPAYVTVTIKKKISEEKNVTYELLNEDKLNEKFSISDVSLDQNTVIVKGSQDTLDKIATVKALIDLSNNKFTEAITYDVDNLPLVAYDSAGNVLENVEIVPNTLSASISFSTYKATVPIVVTTTGDLVAGKAISSITINGKTSYTVDIYGEKEEIDKITSVPVVIDINGSGTGGALTRIADIKKPTGVRSISETDVKIVVTFGDEKQKTINISNIRANNLSSGLTVNRTNDDPISVQVKGVQSVIDSINESNIAAYIDLTNYTAGTYDVDVQIENTDPRIKYVVSNKVNVVITESES